MPDVTKEKVDYFIKSGWTVRQIAGLYATTDEMVKKIRKGVEVRLPKMGEAFPMTRVTKEKTLSIEIIEKIARPDSVLTGRDLIKQRVRDRDKNTCRDCGYVWSGQGKRMDVRSVIGISAREYSTDLDAYVTICHKCNLARFFKEKRVKIMGLELSTPITESQLDTL